MNKVILSGRFTRDPEQRMMSNQTEFSRFSLACQSSYVNKDGERDTEFINCVAFGRTAETINRYCKKGTMYKNMKIGKEYTLKELNLK